MPITDSDHGEGSGVAVPGNDVSVANCGEGDEAEEGELGSGLLMPAGFNGVPERARYAGDRSACNSTPAR